MCTDATIEDMIERGLTKSEALDEIDGYAQGYAEELYKEFCKMVD